MFGALPARARDPPVRYTTRVEAVLLGRGCSWRGTLSGRNKSISGTVLEHRASSAPAA
ncbi:unnamed protein product [Pylaiella littoralis]